MSEVMNVGVMNVGQSLIISCFLLHDHDRETIKIAISKSKLYGFCVISLKFSKKVPKILAKVKL